MNNIPINIIVGVVVGIFTYALIQLVVLFFRKVFIPWYQAIIYQGVKIQGTWHGYSATIENREYVREEEPESTIVLKQQSNRITGELSLTQQPNGEKCQKLFKLEGIFADNVLILRSKVKESDIMGVGTFIMKIVGEGKEFNGRNTYISASDWSTILSRGQIWIRE